jgi:PAS domain S-box-containing protein
MPEREIDERFHLNLEDIKDYAIFRVDPEGRIASWNTGAERMKGYTAEEAIGQPFAMLFTEEDRRKGQPELEMRVAREKGVYQGEGVRVRKGGERYEAEVTLRALADQDGAHRGFVKVTRDISQRKRIEAELRKRAEFEQQLIGIVSHDLRNPLSSILLGAQAVLRGEELSDRQLRTTLRIQTSAERAVRMTRTCWTSPRRA